MEIGSKNADYKIAERTIEKHNFNRKNLAASWAALCADDESIYETKYEPVTNLEHRDYFNEHIYRSKKR